MGRYINISLLLYLLMVKENDFTGKTVIPFFTSASNTLGNSCEILSNTLKHKVVPYCLEKKLIK